MKKTKTWKARRLCAQRRKRLAVQRETRRLLATTGKSYRRWALAHERKAKRADNRAKRQAAWMADGSSKPTEPPRRVAIVDGSRRSAMMMAALLMSSSQADGRR